ncbi:MAG: KpsF/GutQ family sugar-phosphate isomerase [Gemmataceae bacterium]
MPLQVHQPESPGDRLAYARQIIRAEAAALEQVAQRLDDSFLRAVELLLPITGNSRGRLAITGTGKSADIGLKLAGTFNSTGTRSYVLDATKAVHGDLGMLHPEDVALVLSHSGESEEIIRLLRPMKELCRAIIGLTGKPGSSLARTSHVALVYGPLEEVCPLGLAPSASTTAMLGIGDALAFVLSRARDFSHEDFARFHPAGSLGRKLTRVESIMRSGTELRTAPAEATVREVFSQARRTGRRTGAVMLLDEEGRLAGLFTDSDLARLIESRRDAALDRPISEVMTHRPRTLSLGARVAEALDLFERLKISELPILDSEGRPIGLLDITDLISVQPAESQPADERRSA